MKKAAGIMAVLFFSLVIATAAPAQPTTGEWTLGSEGAVAGTWYEYFLGGGEGQDGNELEAIGDGFELYGASLDEVEETGPGSYKTLYVDGTLVLQNLDRLPWYKDPSSYEPFMFLLDPIVVYTTKTVDPPNLEFTIEASGALQNDPRYRIDLSASYSGVPDLILDDQETIIGMSDFLETVTGEIYQLVPVLVDIKPGSDTNPVNVKSRGVLPVALLGSEDFDVRTVDPASIRLAGVAPLRSAYEDVGAPGEPLPEVTEQRLIAYATDGFEDLTLKFDTQAILAALDLETLNDGDLVSLTLEGRSYATDGNSRFVGSDMITILKKGQSRMVGLNQNKNENEEDPEEDPTSEDEKKDKDEKENRGKKK